jgi:class 3 adenylate cyclase
MLLSEALGADQAGVHLTHPARRTGTFTIVFSDIEDSTRHATQVGDDAWMKVLDRHESLIRKAADEYGGRIVKNQGDGFMLTFESARRAVAFSVVVQQRLHAERIADPTWNVCVRVGLHAGEAIATADGDLFGRHVIVASRIADQAEGGEIVASAIVRELTPGSIEFEFDDGQSVALKGIGEQVIHRIAWRTGTPDT